MASRAANAVKPLTPDAFEKALGLLALILLGAVLAAMARGYPQWGELPWVVWAHLVTVGTALSLTPVMMWRKRGDRLHRRLGWTWSLAMVATALISFGIRNNNSAVPGGLSWIHLLSILTLCLVPLLIWEARNHKVAAHRSTVRGLTLGALLLAGFFTFPFDRLLGRWLFG